jgi:hypothetical protein
MYWKGSKGTVIGKNKFQHAWVSNNYFIWKEKYIKHSCNTSDWNLTLNLPMKTIVAQPFNVIKWQLKFNPAA